MSSKTEFIPVTTLEDMAIKETERLMENLNSHQIPVKQAVVNRLVPPSSGCPYCMSKIMMQQESLKVICEKFSGLKIIWMPLFPYEIRGVKKLKNFAKTLFGA